MPSWIYLQLYPLLVLWFETNIISFPAVKWGWYLPIWLWDKREIKVKEPTANKAITVTTTTTNRGYSLPLIYIPYWMPRCQKCPLIIIWFFRWWCRHCEKGTGIPFSCLLRQDQQVVAFRGSRLNETGQELGAPQGRSDRRGRRQAMLSQSMSFMDFWYLEVGTFDLPAWV